MLSQSRGPIDITDKAVELDSVKYAELFSLQAALDRVQTFCTTVVVAHRLSTIRNADSIAVLQDGRILEQGSHDILMQRPRGAYRALVNQQQRAI